MLRLKEIPAEVLVRLLLKKIHKDIHLLDLGKMDNHSAEWAAMLHALEHTRIKSI